MAKSKKVLKRESKMWRRKYNDIKEGLSYLVWVADQERYYRECAQEDLAKAAKKLKKAKKRSKRNG